MENKPFHRPRTTSEIVRGRPRGLEKELFLTGLVVILGHAIGSFCDGYDRYFFLDVIVHFAAGAWVAFAVFAAFPSVKTAGGRKKILLSAILAALLVGGVWEVFEFTVENVYPVDFQGPPLDTLSDLIIDALGGLTAAFWIKPRGRLFR